MSDNISDEKQQQQMEEISICADVWLEVFAFVSPVELGHLMALISDRFDVLVDEHFKLRKWSLGSLQIRRATDENGAEIVKSSGERLPIPQGPIPKKLTGFEWLTISYVDQTVIEFLERIRRLFDSGTTGYIATIYADQSRSWEIIWQKIWPLINDNIRRLVLDSLHMNRLRQFSPAMLPNCTNLRSIACLELFPEFPAEDNADAFSSQAMAKWLLAPCEDGRPKMLFCDFFSGRIEGLKGSFVNASVLVNFIICLQSTGIEPFELKNNFTGERLTLRQMYEDKLLLVRCPIVREGAKWAEWEEEAFGLMYWWSHQWNRIILDFNNSDIGDGMLDANDEGPSEPKK